MSRLIAPNFTPGPWVTMNGTDVFTGLGAKTASGTSAAYNDGWHIADCNAGGSYDGLGNLVDIPMDELRANAKLIAAAPMLAKAGAAALEALREEIELTGGCDHSVGICMCDTIRAADDLRAALLSAGYREE